MTVPAALPLVRRAFVDTAAGQVHVRTAGAPGDRPPLLLLHQSPASSLTYAELLPHLGRTRRTIAVDTPGFGESFRPAAQPTIDDYARWIADVPRVLGIDTFDVGGIFTGAAIATALALATPAVRRIVLIVPPLFTAQQQAGFVANAWPVRPRPDGSHLMQEWQRTMLREMPGLDFARRCDAFNEYYRGGENADWGEQAVAVYSLRAALPRLDRPVLVLRAQGTHGDAAGAAALLPDARLVDVPQLGYSMLQLVPEQIAATIADFLDEAPA